MANKTRYYDLDMPTLDDFADIRILNGNFWMIDELIYNAYEAARLAQEAADAAAPINHRSHDNTYGIGSESYYGHVKLVNTLEAESYEDGAALSAYQGRILQNHIDAKAIINHAAQDGTYGLGSADYYGHVKVINNLDSTEYNTGEALSAYQGAVLNNKVLARTASIPNAAAAGVSDASTTSGSAYAAGSFQLTPGLWIVKVTARWAANAAGYRQLWLSTSQTGTAKDFDSIVSYPAVNGAITSEQLTVMISVSSTTTYYIVAQQNSGSSVTLNTRYSLARLGDVL